MKKLRLFVVLLLLSVCVAAVVAGCGSSSGTLIEKLPIDSNMPTQNGANGSGNSGSDSGTDNNPSAPTEPTEPQPEIPPVAPPPEAVENIVIFVAENFEFAVPYSLGDTSVKEPAVPAKHGYSGKWRTYDLSAGGKITVTAEYSLIEYTVTFNTDEASVVKTYTVFDSEVTAPEIAQKQGYTAVWEDFELTYGAPVTVNAVYSLIYYKIYFPVGGENVLRTYTVENTAIDEPAVPHKTGYTGEWRYGELTFGADMFAQAEYSALPATADENFKWKLNENGDGYIITDYVGKDSEVVVPPLHNGLPVTEIAKSSFSNDFTENELHGIIISENVQKIGNSAFFNCTKLISVELPSTLREIGTAAFSYSGVTEINLPQNLTAIGSKAFSFSALTSVNIPDSVEDLGEFAFKNCISLKSVIVGNGLEIIKEETFINCTGLKTIVIGKGVKEIRKAAFDNCTSLESAVFLDIFYWNLTADGWQTSTPLSIEQIKNTASAAHILLGATNTVLFKTDN